MRGGRVDGDGVPVGPNFSNCILFPNTESFDVSPLGAARGDLSTHITAALFENLTDGAIA